MQKLIPILVFLIFLTCYEVGVDKIDSKNELDYMSISEAGNLVYYEDGKGNKIPAFTFVGYQSGEKPIPNVPISITLEALPGDNIQNAIEKLGQLPINVNSFRGAILLKKGIYEVSGALSISNLGIVLKVKGNRLWDNNSCNWV